METAKAGNPNFLLYVVSLESDLATHGRYISIIHEKHFYIVKKLSKRDSQSLNIGGSKALD